MTALFISKNKSFSEEVIRVWVRMLLSHDERDLSAGVRKIIETAGFFELANVIDAANDARHERMRREQIARESQNKKITMLHDAHCKYCNETTRHDGRECTVCGYKDGDALPEGWETREPMSKRIQHIREDETASEYVRNQLGWTI